MHLLQGSPAWAALLLVCWTGCHLTWTGLASFCSSAARQFAVRGQIATSLQLVKLKRAPVPVYVPQQQGLSSHQHSTATYD
jgi:hypothetical protein